MMSVAKRKKKKTQDEYRCKIPIFIGQRDSVRSRCLWPDETKASGIEPKQNKAPKVESF